MASDYVSNGSTTVLFNVMTGMPQLPRQTFKELTEEGVDGVVFMAMGKRGEKVTIFGQTNAADATAIFGVHSTLTQMVNALLPCSLRRKNGIYPTNLMTDARLLRVFQAIACQGGVVPDGTWFAEFEMDFIYVGSV